MVKNAPVMPMQPHEMPPPMLREFLRTMVRKYGTGALVRWFLHGLPAAQTLGPHTRVVTITPTRHT